MCQNHSHHHAEHLPMHINPVGTIRSTVQMPGGCARGQREEGGANGSSPFKRYAHQEADLIIDPQWGELLDGIDEYSHLMVLYWPHLLDPAKKQQRKIHPMGRAELPLYGVFATRTPCRPNPVLVTIVKLLERKGHVLRVQGLEAVDGSPIIDIKPHTGNYCAEGPIKVPQWIRDMQEQER